MIYIKRWMMVVLVIIVGLQFAACSGETGSPSTAPIELIAIEGSKYHRLILTERAAERLGIKTTPIREESIDGDQRLVIPYGALLYGLHGETFAYTNSEPLTYLKQSVTVDYIEGDRVVLVDGPPIGTEVVTIGAAELYGADTGVGQ